MVRSWNSMSPEWSFEARGHWAAAPLGTSSFQFWPAAQLWKPGSSPRSIRVTLDQNLNDPLNQAESVLPHSCRHSHSLCINIHSSTHTHAHTLTFIDPTILKSIHTKRHTYVQDTDTSYTKAHTQTHTQAHTHLGAQIIIHTHRCTHGYTEAHPYFHVHRNSNSLSHLWGHTHTHRHSCTDSHIGIHSSQPPFQQTVPLPFCVPCRTLCSLYPDTDHTEVCNCALVCPVHSMPTP